MTSPWKTYKRRGAIEVLRRTKNGVKADVSGIRSVIAIKKIHKQVANPDPVTGPCVKGIYPAKDDVQLESLPDYEHKPLYPCVWIRLLTLLPGAPNSTVFCTLRIVRASEMLKIPEFEALSYCWGDNTRTCTIQIGGEKLKVTRSLFAALKDLRYPDQARTLWVDAVCINQYDKDEKSEQIALMPKIYGYARQVVVWLGIQRDDDIEDAITWLEIEDSREKKRDYWLTQNQVTSSNRRWYRENALTNMNDSQKIGMRKIFYEASYWSRMWVLQEIYFAKKIEIILGDRAFDWDILSVFIECNKGLDIDGLIPRVMGKTETDIADGIQEAMDTSMAGTNGKQVETRKDSKWPRGSVDPNLESTFLPSSNESIEPPIEFEEGNEAKTRLVPCNPWDSGPRLARAKGHELHRGPLPSSYRAVRPPRHPARSPSSRRRGSSPTAGPSNARTTPILDEARSSITENFADASSIHRPLPLPVPAPGPPILDDIRPLPPFETPIFDEIQPDDVSSNLECTKVPPTAGPSSTSVERVLSPIAGLPNATFRRASSPTAGPANAIASDTTPPGTAVAEARNRQRTEYENEDFIEQAPLPKAPFPPALETPLLDKLQPGFFDGADDVSSNLDANARTSDTAPSSTAVAEARNRQRTESENEDFIEQAPLSKDVRRIPASLSTHLAKVEAGPGRGTEVAERGIPEATKQYLQGMKLATWLVGMRGARETMTLKSLVSHTRHNACTDKRDRIYALLNIRCKGTGCAEGQGVLDKIKDLKRLWHSRNIDKEKEIVPSYKKEVWKVYLDATLSCIVEEASLDILGHNFARLVDLQSPPGMIPSWVLDFATPVQFSPIADNGYYKNKGHYNASQGRPYRLKYKGGPAYLDGRILPLRGIEWDMIVHISQPVPEDLVEFDDCRKIVQTWWHEFQTNRLVRAETSEGAFLRTLMRDTRKFELEQGDAPGNRTAEDVIQRLPRKIKEDNPLLLAFKAWITGGTRGLPPGLGLNRCKVGEQYCGQDAIIDVIDSITGRVFFTTQQGRVGLVPSCRGPKVGDKVCVVNGASTPLILRKTEPLASVLSPEYRYLNNIQSKKQYVDDSSSNDDERTPEEPVKKPNTQSTKKAPVEAKPEAPSNLHDWFYSPYYTFHGAAYVDGMMQGTVIDDLETMLRYPDLGDWQRVRILEKDMYLI